MRFVRCRDNLLFYDKKIPHLEIIKILRRYGEKQQTEEIIKLKGQKISLGSDVNVINLDEVTEEMRGRHRGSKKK